MQTILEGRSVQAAAAGQLLLGCPEDTTHVESIGWLAIATSATRRPEIWLEVDSGGGDAASRAVDIANDTDLDLNILDLAACPRCKGPIMGVLWWRQYGHTILFLLVKTQCNCWHVVRCLSGNGVVCGL